MSGSTEPYSDGSIITAAGQNSAHWRVYTETGLNHIRQLIDRSGVYSAGQIGGWGEAYVDTNGRNNSVDTTIIYSKFDTNKYKYRDLPENINTTQTTSFTNTTTNTGYTGVQIEKNKINIKIKSVIKSGTCNAISCEIRETDRNGVLLGTANFSGNVATFSSPIDLSSYSVSQKFAIVVGSSGSSFTNHYNALTNVSGSSDAITYTNGLAVDGSVQNTQAYNITNINVDLGDGEENIIYHDIPTGTFPATISSAIGVPFIEDWETGADIQYKLTNATEDTGWLDAMNTSPEVSSFTAFTSEPTTLIVKLIPKTTSPTAGYPSVKGFYINSWSD